MMGSLSALQAIAAALTSAVVVAAVRLTVEIETLEDILTSASGEKG